LLNTEWLAACQVFKAFCSVQISVCWQSAHNSVKDEATQEIEVSGFSIASRTNRKLIWSAGSSSEYPPPLPALLSIRPLCFN